MLELPHVDELMPNDSLHVCPGCTSGKILTYPNCDSIILQLTHSLLSFGTSASFECHVTQFYLERPLVSIDDVVCIPPDPRGEWVVVPNLPAIRRCRSRGYPLMYVVLTMINSASHSSCGKHAVWISQSLISGMNRRRGRSSCLGNGCLSTNSSNSPVSLRRALGDLNRRIAILQLIRTRILV